MSEELPKHAIKKTGETIRPSTYAGAGVDIKKEDLTIRGIRAWMTKTFKFRDGKLGAVMRDIGVPANLIDMGDYALAFSADGVGSKVLVAQELEEYGTIGIDLVAMNVNDIICVGAEPLAMVDYLAMCRADEATATEIAMGIYNGCKQADISVVGGETATLPEIIRGLHERAFDLAGAVIGRVDKDKIITGEDVVSGDVVIGFESSGIHSNGLTLARKVLPVNMWTKLLTPTKIYVKDVLTLLREYKIHGLMNITGGAFLNLLRLGDHGYLLDNLPEPSMIFKKIQELGKVSDEEMYKTFNMGVGFCIICDKDTADDIVKKYSLEFKLRKIGTVTEERLVQINKGDKELILS